MMLFSMFNARIVSVLLRVASLGARFALIFFLAKHMEPESLGLYGLFVSTINISILIAGVDFHVYAQRELARPDIFSHSFIIKNQFFLYSMIYILLIPALFFVFSSGVLPFYLIFWFVPILIIEHFAQEVFRILIFLERQVLVGWLLFVRTGLWVFALFPFVYFIGYELTIELVFIFWFVGAFLSLALACWYLRRLVIVDVNVPLDIAWIYRGLKVSLFFMLSSLSFKALFVVDRYALEILSSTDILGAYVFFGGVALGVISFIEPSVISFLYPKLLKFYANREFDSYRKIIKELVLSTLLVSLLLSLLSFLIVPYVVVWLDKAIYYQYSSYYYIFSVFMFFYACSLSCHYVLYSLRKDSLIVASQFSSLCVFCLLSYGGLNLFKFEPFVAISMSLTGAFIWMFVTSLMAILFHKRLMFP